MPFRSCLRATGSIIFLLFVIEATIFVFSRVHQVPFHAPSYSFSALRGGTIYTETNPSFGVWHRPNLNTRADESCANIAFRTNSFGARDQERLPSGDNRTVVLGDSFVEGMGVEEPNRFTNILERESGREYLNFGTAGYFSPTQYLMLYRTLAPKFEHDTVFVALLPANDFLEDDIEYAHVALPDRYRPYFVGAYPSYSLRYFRPDLPREASDRFFLRHFLREFSWIANAWDLYRIRRFRPSGYSGYFDYTRDQLQRLRYVLQRLRSEAVAKRFIVVTLPQKNDHFRAKAAQPPLIQEMRKLAEEIGFEYFDLLEPSLESDSAIEELFLCDGHWNAKGHERAARLIGAALSRASNPGG